MSKINKKPNIFDFATTELSQDAFLCWLVSWLRYPDTDQELNRCAKDFIVFLYNSYHVEFDEADTRIISPDQVEELVVIKNGEYILQQYKKIDVYFQIKITGKIVSFIVEDKTHTSHHSKQLERYAKSIRGDKIHEDETIMIYFKTGYPYRRDYTVKNEKFYPLFYKKWWKFLDKYNNVTDPFFTAYRNYFYSKYYYHYEVNLQKLYKNDGHKIFKLGFPQYKFLEDLSKECTGPYYDLYPGTSYGRPWAQYPFIKFDNCYGDKPEYILYRLDSKDNYPKHRSPFYLSIRQFADINKKDSLIRGKKVERLRDYQKIAKECDEQFNNRIEFEEKIRMDWLGAKESEITCLHFDSTTNTTQSVLKDMGKFHDQFVKKVKKQMSNY